MSERRYLTGEIFECQCGCHFIEVKEHGDAVNIEFLYRVPAWREGGDLRHRLRSAWQLLRGRNVAGDEYMLASSEAVRLGDAIRMAGFRRGRESKPVEEWLQCYGCGNIYTKGTGEDDVFCGACEFSEDCPS